MKDNFLYKTEEIVKVLLQEEVDTRKDDMYLYYRYCRKVLGFEKIKTMESVMEFNKIFIDLFLSGTIRRSKGVRTFESVRRCRQKLQAMYPNLREQRTERNRIEAIHQFRAYALK
jgi:hypothetical protein